MKTDLLAKLLQNWPAKILSFLAAVLLFVLTSISTLEERYITVQIEFLVPDGFALYSSSVSRIPISLRGNSEGIWEIGENDVSIVADFRDVADEGSFKRQLIISRRGRAASVDPLEISPEILEVQADVQRYVTKSVRVMPRTRGDVGSGYDLVSVEPFPAAVNIGGPRGAVEQVSQLATEFVDLTGKTENFSQRVSVIVPDSRLRVEGSGLVDSRVTVNQRIVSATMESVEIVTIDLAEGLLFADRLPRGKMTIQGPQLLVDEYRASGGTFAANMARLRVPGTYRVALVPQVPEELIVLSYEPLEIEVHLVNGTQLDGAGF